MIRYCAVVLLLVLNCYGYKFLVYSPIFGYSHTKFMGAIADTLTEAGHDVTVLMPIIDYTQEEKTGVTLTKKIIKVPADPRVVELIKYKADRMSKMWTMQPNLLGALQISQNITRTFYIQCERVLSDKTLLKQLENEHFDVGIAEAFSICGLGVFESLKIPASIATFSGVHLEAVASAIGEPINPSYVPGEWSTSGDRMTFTERFKNILSIEFGRKLLAGSFDTELEAFRGKFGRHFKGYEQLLAEASFVMTNSNPYIDFPRPMLHKTVPIGGITVSMDSAKNKLSPEWDAILNERSCTVLVSFGSGAKAVHMPTKYMKSLLKVIESMPETTFIMKYEEEKTRLAVSPAKPPFESMVSSKRFAW
ncbi:UDP-glucoronosyl and UDP-glucosyl transferase [Oesophagostomum dentatum]|uniref:glucuronosyltransferase n=1 Tax=Oesophagostomum dentatum TaxID=61180 RepID=A0A0B1S886_OESDE|nr:UDP-glucoronosyl and UDP-glucosyl transferase [Oesophagostomum dentatum]